MANYDKFIPASLTLDDTYAIKILICYFMRQIDRPITHNQLAEIATADGSVNYFVFSGVLAGMIDSGMIIPKTIDSEEYYTLSENAYEGANDFKRMVPKSFRDRILTSGLKFFAKLKNDNDVKIDTVRMDRGYSVNCVCKEGELTLMELKLFAPDEEQAQMLADKIRDNPADFYAKVIDYALENEEYEPQPEEVTDI